MRSAFFLDDEAAVGAPHRHREAALLAPPRHEVAVVDLEVHAEAAVELVPPLQRHRRRAHHQHPIDPLPQHQLLQHQPCLDGLPQPHVVGDEQVDPR